MTEAQGPFDPQYWQKLSISASDLDALSSHLLEQESPSTPLELAELLIKQHVESYLANDPRANGQILDYLPKESYGVGQQLVFGALDGRQGEVVAVRAAQSLPGSAFKVLEVDFGEDDRREFAAELEQHALNGVPEPEPE